MWYRGVFWAVTECGPDYQYLHAASCIWCHPHSAAPDELSVERPLPQYVLDHGTFSALL